MSDLIYEKDVLEGLSELDDNSIDIIVADPPYNIGKDFGNKSDKQKMEDYLNWCENWVRECERVLKPTGTMYIYGFSEILAYIRVRVNINVQLEKIYDFSNSRKRKCAAFSFCSLVNLALYK